MGRRFTIEPTPNPSELRQPDGRWKFPAVFAGVAILIFALAGWIDSWMHPLTEIPDQPLSVYEVWQWAEELDGQVIHVQGKADFMIMMTAVLCCPPKCDCNMTDGSLRLVSENPTRVNIDCAIVDLIEIDIPDCQGDECSLTCAPFYPGEIEAFEFTGQLDVFYLRGHPCSLKLTHVDLPASKQWVNGVWEPIPTGTFTIPLAQPTQDPSLCEDWGLPP
jgi:hypothetical protein